MANRSAKVAPASPVLQHRRSRTFVLHLRAEPGTDAEMALRALLKVALRVYRLRCTRIAEQDNAS